MATNKHRRKRHYKKRHQTQKRRSHRRHRHYKRRHSNTSLKEYLSSDNRDSHVVKDTVINSDISDTGNNGNIIHGLRDLLSNKKK